MLFRNTTPCVYDGPTQTWNEKNANGGWSVLRGLTVRSATATTTPTTTSTMQTTTTAIKDWCAIDGGGCDVMLETCHNTAG